MKNGTSFPPFTPLMRATAIVQRCPAIRISVAAIISLLITYSIHAEGNQSATPHEPLLPRAPEMAAWTITYVYPTDKITPDKTRSHVKKPSVPKYRITSVKFEKTGDIYHKTTYWDTGKQTEAWSVKGREVVKDKDSSEYVPTSVSGPLADDFTDSDFEDLNWVSMKHFKALEQGAHGGFVFRAKRKDRDMTRRETIASQVLNQFRTPNTGAKSSDNLSGQTINNAAENQGPDTEDTVVLNAANQLPVEYSQGSTKWTYEFTTPPTNQLEPPAEVVTLLDHWDNFIKASEPSVSSP